VRDLLTFLAAGCPLKHREFDHTELWARRRMTAAKRQTIARVLVGATASKQR
jgi:hypothetical protein